MKRNVTILLSAIFMAVVFTNCEDMLNLELEITSESTVVDFEIPAMDTVGEGVLATNVISSDFDSVLAANNVTRDEIGSISLKEAVISITNENPDVNFDMFDYIEASIEVEGLEEIVIAYTDSIPVGARTIECKVNSTELIDYISSDAYILRAKGKTNAPIEENLFVHGELKFAITTLVSDAIN